MIGHVHDAKGRQKMVYPTKRMTESINHRIGKGHYNFYESSEKIKKSLEDIRIVIRFYYRRLLPVTIVRVR